MSENFKSLFEDMISGNMPDANIAKHLQKLEEKGVSETELSIAAKILRERMVSIQAPYGAVDIVGTGGDGLKTYNISTACCFVVAGAGAVVAKHGNRAVSSRSGASDVLRELGVKLDITLSQTQACFAEAGVGFLFAPNHHKAMGNVAKARALLGTRTIFNRLGPLCNPANVEYILIGVYSGELRDIYVKTLLALSTQRALVVHGGDGMDEITTTCPTMVSELNGGEITEYEITPEQFGLKRAKLKDLEGGDAKENAAALLGVLKGKDGPYTEIVWLNSAAALYAGGHASTIADGINMAKKSIANGYAYASLKNLIRVSNA